MFPKVLLAAPQHESKNYCWDEWIERVKNLTYPNYDIFIADNSPDKRNLDRQKMEHGIDGEFIKQNKKGLLHTINDAHNACREKTLAGKYDYLFHLETDIIPPIDVIERLMNHKRRVCVGTYDIFHGSERTAMISLDDVYDRSVRGYRETKMIDEREPLFFDGTVKRIYTGGLGCALIHKDILWKIPFRVVEGLQQHSDSWFAADCKLHNIAIYADTDVQCRHLNSTWLNLKGEIQ